MNQRNITIGFQDDEIHFDGNDDSLIVSADRRHSKVGYRVSRYTYTTENGEVIGIWDESYSFYETLGDILDAYVAQDYTAGRKAF